MYEREQLFVYKQQGKCLREIGRLLDRDHSVISRELKRNSNPHEHMRGYIGTLAHQQAKDRKKNSGKRPRLKHADLQKYVQEKMKIGWTPEIIASQVSVVFKVFLLVMKRFINTCMLNGQKVLFTYPIAVKNVMRSAIPIEKIERLFPIEQTLICVQKRQRIGSK